MHRRDFFVKGQSEVDSRLLHEMLKGFIRSMLLSLAITMTIANPARAASPALSVPDDVQLLLMIKTTLIAFNQANITGNYTVLRDLAAPDFQMRIRRRGWAKSSRVNEAKILIYHRWCFCSRNSCGAP